jgi:AP2-associated kinase
LSKINTPGSSAQPTKASPVETIPSQRTAQRPAAPPKPKKLQTGGSRPDERVPPSSSADVDPTSPTEDWEKNFSRRYPSLSGLEMVETEIDVPKLSSIRTREI